MNALELKPCPFCGSSPATDYEDGCLLVFCDTLNCAAKSINSSALQWNARSNPRQEWMHRAALDFAKLSEWWSLDGKNHERLVAIIAEHAPRASAHPPLPEIHDGKITRADVITSLSELRDMAYAYERSLDSSFRRLPDLETILEHIAIHGLEPRQTS